MERGAWTEERLDDLAEAMRSGFARNDQDLRDLRGEIGAIRSEMNKGFEQVRSEMISGLVEVRQGISRLWIAMMAGFVAVIAAVVTAVLTQS